MQGWVRLVKGSAGVWRRGSSGMRSAVTMQWSVGPSLADGPLLNELCGLPSSGTLHQLVFVWPLVKRGSTAWIRLRRHRARAAGLRDAIKGIVMTCIISHLGVAHPASDRNGAACVEATAGWDIPVLLDFDCNHTILRLTIPNRVLATRNSSHNLFRIDEPECRSPWKPLAFRTGPTWDSRSRWGNRCDVWPHVPVRRSAHHPVWFRTGISDFFAVTLSTTKS